MENVIAVLFKNESDGYQLITELRNTPKAEQALILQMALVKRDESGLSVSDSYDGIGGNATGALVGGLTGSLIGVLGGPIGMMLMGYAGVVAGSMADVGGSVSGAALLEIVADKLVDGDIALLILAEEEDEAYLDEKAGRFPAEIVRFDALDVEAEVEEAVLMNLEMARQAREQLRETRREDLRSKLQKRRDERRVELEAELETYKKIYNI